MGKNIKELIPSILKRAGEKLVDYKNSNNRLEFSMQESQYKAEADIIIDNFVRKEIEDISNVMIISEEDKNPTSAEKILSLDECYILDPIDGTASFVNGFKGYVIQIAYLESGVPTYSCVYAPEFNHLYEASLGKGAFLNGERIKTSKSNNITFIDNYSEPTKKIERMMSLTPYSSYIECGSIGLKICKVASGEADIFFKDVVVKDWDVIPPTLILREAGGYMLSLEGKELDFLVSKDLSHNGLIALSQIDYKQYVLDSPLEESLI